MLDNFSTFLKKKGKKEPTDKSKNAAKERLHLVLMQDRANVSADFLEMMKQEIVDVVKKYIDVDETDMDVKGAPALYANIPIVGINEEKKKESQEISKAKKEEEIKVETKEKKVVRESKEAKPANKKSVAQKMASVNKIIKRTDKNAKVVTKNKEIVKTESNNK